MIHPKVWKQWLQDKRYDLLEEYRQQINWKEVEEVVRQNFIKAVFVDEQITWKQRFLRKLKLLCKL